MQSYGGISLSGTNNTLQQAILLINSNQEEAFIELFKTDPDGMFAVETAENVYFYAKQVDNNNISKLFGRLSYQYIADKTRLEEWDKAAAFYLGAGRYDASIEGYVGARITFEKAWFFMQKLAKQQGDSYDASKDVGILKEWLLYTAKSAEKIPQESVADWGTIYEKIYTLQILTAISIKIADRTKQPQDLDAIEKCHGELAAAHWELAEYFYKLAADMNEDTKKLIPLIDARLCYSQANIQQAISLYKLMQSAEQKIVTAERKHVLIAQERERLKDRLGRDKQILSKNLQYMAGTMVENRNANVAEIRSFIKDNIDINAPLDFFSIAPDGEFYEPREVRMVNWSIGSGSLEVVKLIFEEFQAKIWLFPTAEKKGLIEDLADFTTPEVREYLLTPNERFYQVPEQKECVEFFQDALAGRLDKVQEKLNSNAKLIYQYPQIEDDNDVSLGECVLQMACHGRQLHVVWYLEEFIASYILDNTDHVALEKLYHCMMDCYEKYSWNERRSALVENLKNILLNLLNSAINEFATKAADQLTDEDKKEFSLNKYALLLITYTEGKKFESDGHRCTNTDKLTYYEWANTKYQLVIDKIFDPDFERLSSNYQTFCDTIWASKERVGEILNQAVIASIDNEEIDDGDEKKEVVPMKADDSRPANSSTQTWANTFRSASSSSASPTSTLPTDGLGRQGQPSSSLKRKYC